MSSPAPAHGPLAEDEAVGFWMQNRSSVFWTHLSLLIRPKLRLPLSNRPAAIQDSYLLNLPIDCLRQIILLLDIKSLFRFRQTAVTTKRGVESLCEFRNAIEHGYELLGATFKCMVAERISLFEFNYELCNKNCVLCNNVANYVNVQTWKRVCDRCVHEQGRPGCRDDLFGRITKKTILFDYLRHQWPSGNWLNDSGRFRSPNLLYPEEDLIRIPHWNTKTNLMEYGMSCVSCLQQGEEPACVYDRQGFLEHFHQCEGAQREWKQHLREGLRLWRNSYASHKCFR
ncbi:hypothetical protein FPOAC1_005547 [Fusarium poae]|uniref:hypothetical protein n=1 Tax=Fusarium poae TaxID=36050 RepID=UPI001CEBAF22|nr:hypothetical protein FPOAC1_005547 [Fusarium poae]KAG8672283.1 hypothetical protein FPOAC1_005547 [Fusarium poae]